MVLDIPPLHGKNGIYRVVIHGNSGTGKTTLSKNLAKILQVLVLHLDELHWRPGWVEAPDEEMTELLTYQIERAIQTESGWVIDGNYERSIGRIVDSAATDIINLFDET